MITVDQHTFINIKLYNLKEKGIKKRSITRNSIIGILLAIFVASTTYQTSFAKPIVSYGDSLVAVNNLSTNDAVAQKQMQENICNKGNAVQNQTTLTNKGTDYTLENIEVEQYKNIVISGTISKNNTTRIFNLSGELKRADDSTDIVVGSLVDNNDIYDIVYFSINNNSDKFISATGIKRQDTTLNLYLCEKGTRNYYFIETAVPENINTIELFRNVQALKNCEAGDVFWLAKVLSPKITSKNIDKTNGNNNSSMLSQVPQLSQTAIYRRFTFSYTWISQVYNEIVDIDHYFKYPANVAAFDLHGIIKISSTWTVNVTKGTQISSTTTVQVGANDTMKIICGVGSPLNISLINWGGTTAQGGTISVSPSIGVSLTPWLSLGVNFNPCSVSSNPPISPPNGQNMAKVTLSNGQYLKYMDNQFNGIFNYMNTQGTNSNLTTSAYMRYQYTLTHPVAPAQTFDDYLSVTVPINEPQLGFFSITRFQ